MSGAGTEWLRLVLASIATILIWMEKPAPRLDMAPTPCSAALTAVLIQANAIAYLMFQILTIVLFNNTLKSTNIF